MNEMEDKINAILENPDMMKKIMTMAQSLGVPSQETPRQDATKQDFDPAMLQSIMQMAQKTSIDHNQQTLLKALKPYLNQERIAKLERAMRAARLAGVAGNVLGNGGLNSILGR